MVPTELERILARLRDAVVDAEEVDRALVLIEGEERVPLELRIQVRADLMDDPVGAAAGLLAVLGADDLGGMIARALEEEAGAVDPCEEVLGQLGLSAGPPVHEAVWDEAGVVDVREPVMAQVEGPEPEGLDWSELIGLALRDEAGPVDLTDAILTSIEAAPEVTEEELPEDWPLAEAVRAEAGEVDVAGEVVDTLGIERIAVASAVRFAAGRVEVAAEVSRALGHEVAPVAEAVRAEAGEVDVTAEVLAALEVQERALPLAEAVRDEAGEIEVAPVVAQVVEGAWTSAFLDDELPRAVHRLAAQRLRLDPSLGREMTEFAELGRGLRAAVEEGAGEPPMLWSSVAEAIGADPSDEVAGWDGARFAEAVRAEAGEVDVVRQVMRRVRRTSVVPVAPEVPLPVNHNWVWGALALAAVALIAVLVAQPWGSAPADQGPELQFADAREITIDDLSYSEDAMVQVIQASDENGAEGALIIWVDEEAVL